MNNLEIERLIKRALTRGVDFAEVFQEDSIVNSITIAEQGVNNNQTQEVKGIGLRVFTGDEFQYQSTDVLSEQGIKKLIDNIKGPKMSFRKVEYHVPEETDFPAPSQIKIYPEETPIKRKLEYLREVEQHISKYDSSIKNVILLYQDKTQNITIANSEGLFAKGKRSDIILIAIALVEYKGGYSIGGSFIGGSNGGEILDREPPEKIARESAEQALRGINPQPIPQEQMPIIFSNRSGIFHECLGHPLEARHRDGVFKDKLDQRLTKQNLTVIDDATIPDLGGSYAFDDEGTASQRNILIDKGVLKGFLYDRFYAQRYQTQSTGNARRVSYEFPPLVRMSNLIIESGSVPFEDMVKETKKGILVEASFGGGRSFVYEGIYMLPFYSAFYIENGKVAYPIKPFIYKGTTLKTLQDIEMIGNDFKQFSTGRCGLDQVITVTYGAPSVKLKETETMNPLEINQLIEAMKNLKI